VAETHPRVSSNVHVTIDFGPQAPGPGNFAVRVHFQLAPIILPPDLVLLGILDIDIRHPNRRGSAVVDRNFKHVLPQMNAGTGEGGGAQSDVGEGLS